MSPAGILKVFAPLWSSVGGALRKLAGHLPGGGWHLPVGVPWWAVALGVAAAGWAVAEALSGLVKAVLRIAALAAAVYLVMHAL